MRREGSLWLPKKHCKRNNKERGMERRENTGPKEKHYVTKAEHVHSFVSIKLVK